MALLCGFYCLKQNRLIDLKSCFNSIKAIKPNAKVPDNSRHIANAESSHNRFTWSLFGL